ncbi:cell cycle checkpoint protein RAD17 [Neocloeon triangulifer]|uniref:cell cycle checkpoint protein RAD17 n=1 Tax=Neocloeon triangulifer TaxID=2078957 RepID=UPI00286F7EAC|nr:cell cycle checkpoint protein RAD17 [Neocloeon triangulifer]
MSQENSKNLKKWVVPSFGGCSIDDVAPKSAKKRPNRPTGRSGICKFSTEISWVEKHSPCSVSELAVHKKKVDSVYDWLKSATSGQSKAKFCWLKGPSGSGKSTTVKVAAQELGIDVKEWITPSSNFFYTENDDGGRNYEDYRSDTDLVREFVIKGSRFPSLFAPNLSKWIVMVEDWPLVLLQNPTKWHNILEEFAEIGKCPLIMVTGEEQVYSKLVPDFFVQSFGIQTFSFNPLAPTLLKKILTEVAQKEAPSNVSVKDVVENICQSSCGDLRSAINTLQFACSKDFGNTGKVHKMPETKRRKTEALAKQGSEKLAKIGGRDAPDDFFHTISRTLYAKRLDDGNFKTSPDEIVANVSDRTDMFTGFMQENYLDFMPDIQSAAKCAENFELVSRLFRNSFDKPVLQGMGLDVVTRAVMSAKRVKSQTSSFKSHRKPKYIQVEKNLHQLNMDCRSSFSLYNTSSQALLTEILPYMTVIQPPRLSSGQTALVMKMALERPVFLKPSVPVCGNAQNGSENDPEMKIEEVDSD